MRVRGDSLVTGLLTFDTRDDSSLLNGRWFLKTEEEVVFG